MYDFEFTRPTTLADAKDAMKGEDAQALGGGQTLIPTLKQRLASPATLVSLSAIDEIKGICKDDDGQMCIGGGTTHHAIMKGGFAGLAGMAERIGCPSVRNRGTLGGVLANNDPAACYTAAVLATGATVVTDQREIAADEFFQGMFTTALDESEIITEVKFPVPDVSNYQKFVQPASRFALVGVFLAKFGDDVRVAVTGASEDGVFRWSEGEAALSSDFSACALDGLSVGANGLMTDIHGSAAYRAHLIKVMTGRAVDAAA